MNYFERFRVAPGTRVSLAKVDPDFRDRHEHREAAASEIELYRARLFELQERLYAGRECSLLICLQAMDTGGKDGTIRHFFSAMNPQGCRVAPFRQPSAEEAAHDFLWRAHRAAPALGEVAIFNRSYYEEVLIERVHGGGPEARWHERYELINAFERMLAQRRTHILKFFLHISAEEQLARFKQRLEDPNKQWKISDNDYRERQYWDAYQRAYEDALSRCSTAEAPWFVIPANHKWFRNLAVARIVVEFLEGIALPIPKPSVNLAHIRREYEAALEAQAHHRRP